MLINIEYKLNRSPTIFKKKIDPIFYFDENESISFDSTARYIFPYEYLNIDVRLLEEISLIINDEKSEYLRTIKFWNNSKCNSDNLFIYNDFEKTIIEWLKIEMENENYFENLDFYKNKLNMWELHAHYMVLKNDFSQNFIYKKEINKDTIQGLRFV